MNLLHLSVLTILLGLLPGTFAVKSTEPKANSLLHLIGQDFYDKVYQSNDMFVVTVLEEEERCGEQCTLVKDVLTKVHDAADGAILFGYMHVRELIPNVQGEMVPIYMQYNVTSTPVMLVFPAGKKTDTQYVHPLILAPEAAVTLLGNGPKAILDNIRQFVPSMVTSVRQSTLADFLTKTYPSLPRIILFSNAKDIPLPLKRLAIDFASRASFGFAKLSDNTVGQVFLANEQRRLFIGPPGPYNVKVAQNPGEGMYAEWTVYKEKDMTYPALFKFLNSTLPYNTVPQLTSSTVYDKYCGDVTYTTVCFIAVLNTDGSSPTGTTKSSTDTRLALFEKVANQNFIQPDFSSLQRYGSYSADRIPASFSWIDATEQMDFIDSFHISAPGLLALNPRKKVYAILKQSFNEVSISNFVHTMMNYRPGNTNNAFETEAFNTLIELQPIKDILKLKSQIPAHILNNVAGNKKGNSNSGGGSKAPKNKKEL